MVGDFVGGVDSSSLEFGPRFKHSPSQSLLGGWITWPLRVFPILCVLIFVSTLTQLLRI